MTDRFPQAPFRILNPQATAPEFHGRCALAVMAKAPTPGKVKTRLSPPLSPEQAALLNADFLRDTLASLNLAALESPANCVVSYTPVGEEAAFAGILPPSTLLVPQRGDGFGERLFAAVSDLLHCGFSAVCLIDSDSPTVPTAAFVEAVRTLLPENGHAADRAVLGPSEDGGYYLIGMTAPHPRLFGEIAWSTDVVAAQTAQRAAELELPLTLLPPWYDVDDRVSLERLRRELAGDPRVPQGYAAPNTRGFLLSLDGGASPPADGAA